MVLPTASERRAILAEWLLPESVGLLAARTLHGLLVREIVGNYGLAVTDFRESRSH